MSAKRNILFVAFQFPPESGPAVHRNFRIANELASQGHQVTVLTRQIDEFAISDQAKDTTYLERFHPNLNVERHKTYEPVRLKEKLMQWRVYRLVWCILYPLLWEKTALWAFFSERRVKRIIEGRQIELLYTSSGPFSTLFFGLLIKRVGTMKWIADLRDPFTDAYMWNFPSKLHWWFARTVEYWLLAQPDQLIVTTPSYKQHLVSRKVRDESTIEVITNGY